MATKKKPTRKPKPKPKAKPISERQRIAKLLTARADMRFGGESDTLNRILDQQRAHGAPGGGIDQAFQAYQAQLQGALNAQRQAAETAAAQQRAAVQGIAGAQDKVAQMQGQERTQADATFGRAAGTAAPDVNAALKAGAGVLGGIQAGGIAGAGLAGSNFLLGMGGIAGMEKIASGQRNERKVSELVDQKRGLGEEIRAFKLSELDRLREEAARNELAAATLGQKQTEADRRHKLALAGFELDQERVASQAADRARDDRRADAKLKIDERRLAGQLAKWEREGSSTKDSAGKPMSAAQINKWRSRKSKVLAAAEAFRAGNRNGLDTHEVSERLGKNKQYTRDEINMARDLAVHGFLSRTNQAAAKGYFPGGVVPKGFVANHPANKRKKKRGR